MLLKKIYIVPAIISGLILSSCAGAAYAPTTSTPRPDIIGGDRFPDANQHIVIADGEFDFEKTTMTVTPAPEPTMEHPVEENPEAAADPSAEANSPSGSPRTSGSNPRNNGDAGSPNNVPSENGGPAPSGPAKYAGPTVGGFFLFTSSNPDTMVSTVNAIRDTGADTLITFGSRLKPTQVSNNKPAGDAFAGCTVNGQGCLYGLLSSRGVNRVFTYEDKGQFSPAAFQCDGDQNITADNGHRFTVLVIPRNGDCWNAPDVVVTRDMTDRTNANRVMIDTARDRGMGVFVGMPAPVMRTDQSWLPDMSYTGTLDAFTQRFLVNYRESYRGNPGLVGFYHHVEMPLKSSGGWNDVRALYSSQNILIRDNAPGYAALVSPYMDARKNYAASTPLSDIPQATRMLADTAHGTRLIIAPQDGQGTGKVGAYDASTAHNQVDTPSAAIAGSGTYSQVYQGGTGDYMSAVLAGAGGTEVWVNLELMTGSTQGTETCEGASNGRGKAGIDRVREQARIGTPPGVRKTIGFMWQPYATCGSDPLSNHLR